MLPQLPARLLRLHRLEQRAEDRRGDRAPVEQARLDQLLSHGRVEVWNRDGLSEHGPVHVREAQHQLVRAGHALVHRTVQHLEQRGQLRAQVRAVLGRAGLDELQEQVPLPQPRVVGKQREQGPHQEHGRLVLVVSGALQLHVEVSHQLRGLHGRRGLLGRTELALLVTGDEPEPLGLHWQLLQRELDHSLLPGRGVQVAQAERLEVAGDHVPRLLHVGHVRQVRQRLILGGRQVLAQGLLLRDEHAGPKHVDEPGSAVGLLRPALVLGHLAATDSVDREQLRPERLGLTPLVGLPRPLVHERGSVRPDLVPGQGFGLHEGRPFDGDRSIMPRPFGQWRQWRAAAVVAPPPHPPIQRL